MLICAVCNKVIANIDPTTIRWGGCSSCPLDEVHKAMLALKNDLPKQGDIEVKEDK